MHLEGVKIAGIEDVPQNVMAVLKVYRNSSNKIMQGTL
jgi:hypothetical protein